MSTPLSDLYLYDEGYSDVESGKKYTFSYAQVLSQFYAAMLSYSLYLQDYDRKLYFEYMEKHKEYLSFQKYLEK